MTDDPGEREAAVLCPDCGHEFSPDPVSEPVEPPKVIVEFSEWPVSEPVENCRICDLTYPAGTKHRCTDGWASPDPVSEPVELPHPTLSQPWGDPDYDPTCADCRMGVHGRVASRPVSEPVDGLREAHEDEPTARRLMELATDAEWSDKADLAAWTRVVRDIRGPVRALAAAPAEPVDGLREAADAYVGWQYRMKGARRFTLTDLRAALAAAPAEDRGTQCTGYAGDPGASAPRCESYEGHPGRHFIRPFAARRSGDPR